MTNPTVIDALNRAWNTHDLNALADCLHADYESVNPLHPERNFWGRDAALRSWEALFTAVPDLHADLLRCAGNGDEAWTEWRWSGTHVLGYSFNAGGVMVFGLDGEHIRWARVYTEIVQTAGPNWEAVLDDVLKSAGLPRVQVVLD